MIVGLNAACIDGLDPVTGESCTPIFYTIQDVPLGVTTGPPAPGNTYDPATGVLTLPDGKQYKPDAKLTLQYDRTTGQNVVAPTPTPKVDNSLMYVAIGLIAFGFIALGQHR